MLDQDCTANCPTEKWTGDITAVWAGCRVALPGSGAESVFAMGDWPGNGDDSGRNAHRESATYGATGSAAIAWLLVRIRIADPQYTSEAYRVVLAGAAITVSMSCTGNCYDNAVTASFFGRLSGECVECTCFQTRSEARQAIFEYVECFYNRLRRHSSLGYVSPVAYEQVRC